jgi:beta-mannanase
MNKKPAVKKAEKVEKPIKTTTETLLLIGKNEISNMVHTVEDLVYTKKYTGYQLVDFICDKVDNDPMWRALAVSELYNRLKRV